MDDKYKRLTATQVELWLNDPCTLYLFECLKFKQNDINALIADPSARVADNNLTCQRIDAFQGQKVGIDYALDPETLFAHYGMVEEDEDVAA